MNSNLATFVRMSSASIATLVSGVALPLLALNNPKLRSAPIIAGAVVLTLSGWVYAGSRIRVAGIIHAALMAGIGVYSLATTVPFLLDPHGLADNAAAGVIALSNFVVVVFGAVVLACGVGVIWQIVAEHRATKSQ
jgi:hypothetical protein